MSCKNGKPDHLGHRFRVIHTMIDKYFQKNREAGRACNLTRAQCGAIHYFYDHREEDIFQKDFETEFSISGATATNILKVLEREKLIERIPMKEDGRLKKIVLLDAGAQVHEEAYTNILYMEKILTKGMNIDEIANLRQLLDKVIHNLEDLQELQG